MESKNTAKTRSLVEVALFSAIVLVLAFTPMLGYIPLGFTRATTIHIPVILASILLGPKKGAMIGLVFGLTSLFKNTFEPTATSFVFSPFYSLGDVHGNFFSLIICLLPRMLIGVVPFYVFKFTQTFTKLTSTVALGIAGLSGALTNTLLVMNLIYVFFAQGYSAANSVSGDALYGFILSVICINGIPEAVVAALLVGVIGKVLLGVRRKQG